MSAVIVWDEAANEINRQYALVRGYGQEMLATEPGRHFINAAVRFGELLEAKKIELPRGRFDEWVRTHCSFGRATAYNYIKFSKSSNPLDGSALRHLFPSGRRSTRALLTRGSTVDQPDELIEALSRLSKLCKDIPDDKSAIITAIDDACARLNELKNRLQEEDQGQTKHNS